MAIGAWDKSPKLLGRYPMQMRRIQFIKYVMFIINVVAVLFVAVFIHQTTGKICDYFIAREFLDTVRSIPAKPDMIILVASVLLGTLLVSLLLRDVIYEDRLLIRYVSLIVDFVVCIATIYVLDFNYNAILFWLFANMVFYIRREKSRLLFIILAIVSYVFTDYGLISINLNLYSINDYIGYYDASTQQYLFGIYNLLSSVNIIIFIIFCIYVIQEQRGTIEEVNTLYAKLSSTNEELQNANEELKQYAVMKEKMGETKERNRLAREIHDTLGHTLTGILAGVDACIAIIDRAPDQTKKQLEVVAQVTRKGIREVRQSVHELRPDALKQHSLKASIDEMIEDTRSVTGAKITFDLNTQNLNFDEDEEKTIFRVVQESVTNSIRHGKASEINIIVRREYMNIRITIKDNGIGCKEFIKGFGTTHIQERIELLQGRVIFDGTDGFLTEVVMPIRWGKSDD